MSNLNGLTVRWSLVDAPADTADRLRDYVEEPSHAKFTGKPGMRFKTWRMVPGQWFEGCYVFESDEARAAFQAEFTPNAPTAPVSELTGAGPLFIEPCEVVAIAEGGAGFATYARF
ncbi:hypothetical protein [Nocardioides jejuensis]|uniref:Uncharacterized protein n=1 Tax=Nocardioides jejuensis TaxID=2502782 RepID=A0A4R1BV29_9ACTN|nr:hypothetical protein [Nocardioides jejuensis]TCJ21176.1 hypothetical protein EPD65_15590 [Nocardioides jejuensis]